MVARPKYKSYDQDTFYMATNKSSTTPISSFTQTNAFAMQHGIVLGLILIILLGTLIAGLTNSTASLISTILIVVYPIIVGRLTFGFRKIVAPTDRFPLFKGFSHALFSMLYASIWAAIATYFYMRFFDNGHFVNTLLTSVSNPRMQELLKANELWFVSQTHSGPTILDSVRQMQNIPPATYAETVLYMNILLTPITSLIIGLCAMRNYTIPAQR